MNKQYSNYWSLVFILVCLVDIFAVIESAAWLHFAAKPLLMPLLIGWLYFSSTPTGGKKLVLTGLLFSWWGDTLLLFDHKGMLFFAAGLVCFLATHIFYILYFSRTPHRPPSLLKKKPWISILVIAYGTSLLILLLPGLGALRIPVIIYAIVICSMLLSSFQAFNRVSQPSGFLFIAGALLFTLSDSLLAWNKFYRPVPGAGAAIMATYCAAQLLIVKGFIVRRA